MVDSSATTGFFFLKHPVLQRIFVIIQGTELIRHSVFSTNDLTLAIDNSGLWYIHRQVPLTNIPAQIEQNRKRHTVYPTGGQPRHHGVACPVTLMTFVLIGADHPLSPLIHCSKRHPLPCSAPGGSGRVEKPGGDLCDIFTSGKCNSAQLSASRRLGFNVWILLR